MPVPKPHKGEKQDDFMERCMHEVSANSDRTNDQNVAICMDAWRNKDASDKSGETNSLVYPKPIFKMHAFKTLAEARGAYDTLLAELTDTKQKIAQTADLEAQLAESKAFGADTATENENFRALIIQKDAEIAGLKRENEVFTGQVSELKSELETFKKQQKTAKTQARELVAASGGAPIAVDQAEISRMQAGTQKEYREMMIKETDPVRLNQLYQEYNRLFRSNGKQKK